MTSQLFLMQRIMWKLSFVVCLFVFELGFSLFIITPVMNEQFCYILLAAIILFSRKVENEAGKVVGGVAGDSLI